MQNHLNSPPISSTPLVAIVSEGTDRPRSTSGNMTILRRLAARLVYLADTARNREDYELEATMTRTAAEILTSSAEIANSGYAAPFIDRLVKSIGRIENNLGEASTLQHSALSVTAH